MNKLIITGVCLSAALTLGFTLTWPKYQALQILLLDIGAKESELQSKQEYFNEVRDIAKQFEGYTIALDKISSALPEIPSLPSLLSFLQSSASENGLILGEITLGDSAKGEISLTAKLFGEYPAFKSFLITLESSARMIEVENIILTAPERAKEPFTFLMQIKAH